jgi:hypothetical protein
MTNIMFCVRTYRVTNEHAWGKEGWDDFTPPLDDIDGAARILQPVRALRSSLLPRP